MMDGAPFFVMKFTFQLTEEDLLTFLLFNAERSEFVSREVQKKRRAPTMVVFIFAALLLLLQNYPAAIAFAMVGITLYLAFPRALKRSRTRYFTNHIRTCCKDVTSGPTTIGIEADGIHDHSATSFTLYPFTAFHDIQQHQNYTYAYLGNGTALVLPHDRVTSEQISALLTAIEDGKRS